MELLNGKYRTELKSNKLFVYNEINSLVYIIGENFNYMTDDKNNYIIGCEKINKEDFENNIKKIKSVLGKNFKTIENREKCLIKKKD